MRHSTHWCRTNSIENCLSVEFVGGQLEYGGLRLSLSQGLKRAGIVVVAAVAVGGGGGGVGVVGAKSLRS